MKLNQLTIKEALRGLQNKTFSAQELTKACLYRIDEIDKKIKAFITVNEEEALKKANEADALLKDKSVLKNKPLLGIPVAVKDNFCTRDLETTAASKVLENYSPVYESTVTRRLKEAGVIIIGKTNMDAWAHGSSTETSQFFTTKNPWNFNRLPGGSSGGSAASIIADEAIGAIGSETAGSIRQPAAWCGLVGFKPTYGRVSRYGLIAMASSLDSPGPMTKTIWDAALMLQILAGNDKMDATTSSIKVPDYLAKINSGIKGVKIGVPKEYFLKEMDKEIVEAVRKAVKILESRGAKIIDVSLIDPKYSVAVYTILQRSEVSSNLARYDSIRYGHGRTNFGEEAKRRIMLGTHALSSGYYEKYYFKAQKVRSLICQDFDRAFKKIDILVAPTSPSVALRLGATVKDPMFGEMQDVLVEASSLAGLPGVNVPCGFSQDLPIGLQIIGPQFSEELLFQVGYAYEQVTDWHKKRPITLNEKR